MVSVAEACEILDNMRIPITASDRKKGIYPYYGANGVQDYVDDYIFDDELVLLAEDGGHFGSKEKPIAYRVSGKCWVNNHAHVLKPKENLNVDYLCYSIMFYDVMPLISGTTRAKLNKAAISKMIIPLPPLHVQQKIADILDRANALIEKRKVQIEKLDLLVKSQFIEMFGDPVTNPKGWDVKALGSLGSFKNGINYSQNESGYVIKCLSVGDFGKLRKIDDMSIIKEINLLAEPSNDYLLQNGDIVFVRSNGNRELVGRSVEVFPHGAKLTFSGFCIRYRNESENLTTIFLNHALHLPSLKATLLSEGRGANIQNVNQQMLSMLGIPIPPFTLQNKFVDFVERIEKQKSAIKKSLELLELNYKSLMQKCFAGEI